MRSSFVNPDQAPIFDLASLDVPAQTRDPKQNQVKMRVWIHGSWVVDTPEHNSGNHRQSRVNQTLQVFLEKTFLKQIARRDRDKKTATLTWNAHGPSRQGWESASPAC